MTISALIAMALAAQATTGTGVEPQTPSWNFELGLENFGHLQRQANAWCAWSRLPDECRAALMAAGYSEINIRMCWERAGEPFPYGGTQSPFVQEEMKRTCAQAIRLCRDNWTYFHDLSAHREPEASERRDEILRQNLRNSCGEELSENAPNR